MTDVLSSARRVRGPAYAVVTECLRIQASARRQSWFAWLFGANPILPDARAWYRGALGEIHVAKVLNGLDPSWTVLYSDEPEALVIGPAGAFTITTKNHSRQRVFVGDDRLLVNGHRTNHIPDARHEARALTHLLGVVVTPVIAVVDPAVLTIKQRVDGVEVLASSQLAAYLGRRKGRLAVSVVADLVAVASADGVWSADVVDETLRHEARFVRLKGEVDAAWRRRVIWIAGAATVVTSLIFAATMVA
ncbi:MAG: hypothetical protein JWR04_695 [Rhodoglobus sp.]|nr:hypothetical protein [Rhodoglobus sp.]